MQQLDHNEEIEIVELTIEEIIDQVMQQKIVQAVHVNCIFFFDKDGEVKIYMRLIQANIFSSIG